MASLLRDCSEASSTLAQTAASLLKLSAASLQRESSAPWMQLGFAVVLKLQFARFDSLVLLRLPVILRPSLAAALFDWTARSIAAFA